jgi:hypothetical protein
MKIRLLIILLFVGLTTIAQEQLVPLKYNPNQKEDKTVFSKKKRAGIPFIDDFSYPSSTPDASLWVESQVYINNKMAMLPPTQGVATFDGLNADGRPYRPNNFAASGYGDSLTAQPIDLTSFSPADSLYISFYIQPQGIGFAPETGDSFFLFLRNSTNNWVKYWNRNGSNVYPFQQILLPINDPQFFHDSFQFRFVNFTSLNLNDDVWNLDYVRLEAFRNEADSIDNDISFSQAPTHFLKNYNSMPYRHFLANAAGELNAQQDIWINNLYNTPQTININHTAIELYSSTPISTNNVGSLNITGRTETTVSNPAYTISYMPPNVNDAVTIRNTYYYNAPIVTDRKQNDTLIDDIIFDNYFAYDDGTAELAYFLNPALNQAAKTAVKFTLNQADTVRGLSVYFAPQVPSAANKFFSIVLYDALNDNSVVGVLQQQDLYQVQYPTGKNEFSNYAFDSPMLLAAGDYYIGITQPANFGSDSIYYGIDANNNNNINVLSYSVNGLWFNSNVQGSIMMRPIVGGAFIPTGVNEVTQNKTTSIYPNPATETITIGGNEQIQGYEILSIDGRQVQAGLMEQSIQVGDLPSGIYLLKVMLNNNKIEIHKLWKQ